MIKKLSFLFILTSILIGLSTISTKAATEIVVGGIAKEGTVKEYGSVDEFYNTGIINGKAKVFASFEGSNKDYSAYVEAPDNGVFAIYSDGNFELYKDKECITVAYIISSEGFHEKPINYNSKLCQIQVEKGQRLYFKNQVSWSSNIKLGFIKDPFNTFVSKAEVLDDGKVNVTAKSKKYQLNLIATKDEVSLGSWQTDFQNWYAYSLMKNDFSLMFDIGDTTFNSEETLTLSKAGTYSFLIYYRTNDKDPCTYYEVMIKTSDIGKAHMIDVPLVKIAGTNVVAGYTTANTLVTVKQGKKTYSATSDETGLYIIKTGKLKKGSTISIYDGKNSKNARKVKIK